MLNHKSAEKGIDARIDALEVQLNPNGTGKVSCPRGELSVEAGRLFWRPLDMYRNLLSNTASRMSRCDLSVKVQAVERFPELLAQVEKTGPPAF